MALFAMNAINPMAAMKRKFRAGGWMLLAVAAALLLAGCREDMHNQPKFIPLRENQFYGDGRSARPVVEGTIARGQLQDDSLLYTGKVDGKESEQLAVPHHAGRSGAWTRALQYLLRAVPLGAGRRQRHDRAERFQEAAKLSRGAAGEVSHRTFLLRDYQTAGVRWRTTRRRFRWPTAGASRPTSAPCSFRRQPRRPIYRRARLRPATLRRRTPPSQSRKRRRSR